MQRKSEDFYETLKQLREKREYNMLNIKNNDENLITLEDKIMEIHRHYLRELTVRDKYSRRTRGRNRRHTGN